MIAVDEARRRILTALERLPAEQVSIAQAAGRVLAEDTRARVTKPPAAVSAMDGYAVRAADVAATPARLAVVGVSPAGAAHDAPLEAGQAVRIFTGGVLPRGADSVVVQENTSREGASVTVRTPVARGRHVRPPGLDFAQGDAGPAAGQRLGPRRIALLAAMNLPWLKVVRRPRVAILGTGDEIAMPGEPLGTGRIAGSNSLALAAMVEQAGGEALLPGVARDDEASLRAVLKGARGADLLVVTGGMSVGEHDLVRKVLAGEGLALDFWKVAMRPGKPLAFGTLHGMAVMGFPGNPVSTLVCGHVFLRPAIARLLGCGEEDGREGEARLGCALAANDERQDYLRARLRGGEDGLPVATPFPRQDSSMLAVLAEADGLVVRPPHAPAAAAGERVAILRL